MKLRRCQHLHRKLAEPEVLLRLLCSLSVCVRARVCVCVCVCVFVVRSALLCCYLLVGCSVYEESSARCALRVPPKPYTRGAQCVAARTLHVVCSIRAVCTKEGCMTVWAFLVPINRCGRCGRPRRCATRGDHRGTDGRQHRPAHGQA